MATAYLPDRLASLAYDMFERTLPVPDRLLLVDVEPRSALSRISMRQDGEEMFENLPALIEIREKMLALARSWRVLDNNGCEGESRERLKEILSTWDD